MVPHLGEVIRAAKPHLPLLVEGVRFPNTVNLSLWGHEWSFSTSSPWRVTHSGLLLLGSDELDANPASLALERVVAIVPQGIGGLDLAFVFGGGEVLEVFSNHWDEPWVFKLPSSIWVAGPNEGAA